MRSSWRWRCFNPQLAMDQGPPTVWGSGSMQMQYSFKKRGRKEKEISKETKYWKELFMTGSFLTGSWRLWPGWLCPETHMDGLVGLRWPWRPDFHTPDADRQDTLLHQRQSPRLLDRLHFHLDSPGLPLQPHTILSFLKSVWTPKFGFRETPTGECWEKHLAFKVLNLTHLVVKYKLKN